MPYIEQRHREKLDPQIESLVQSIRDSYKNIAGFYSGFSQYAGAINYCCTRIAAGLMGPISYYKLALIVGIFVTLIFEFVRRVVTPYEMGKMNDNGDVKEYEDKNEWKC